MAVDRELIPFGLYRLPGARDNKSPYVYTNPNASVRRERKRGVMEDVYRVKLKKLIN